MLGYAVTAGARIPHLPAGFDTLSLLHFDGINGSTTVVDVYSPTWSIPGPGSLSTVDPKWGTACLSNAGFFFGPGAVSNAAFVPAFGLGDITIECWFKSAFATTMVMVNFGINDLTLSMNNGDVSVSSFNTGSGTLVCASTGNDLNNGAWHFAQAVREGLVTSLYIDGVLRASGPDVRDYTGARFCGVGGLVGNSSLPWLGSTDDFRLTLAARPNEVPTGPFTE